MSNVARAYSVVLLREVDLALHDHQANQLGDRITLQIAQFPLLVAGGTVILSRTVTDGVLQHVEQAAVPWSVRVRFLQVGDVR